jgi:hypothetical protein
MHLMTRVRYPHESRETPIQSAKLADEFLWPDQKVAPTSQGRRRDPDHEPLMYRPCGPFIGHDGPCRIPKVPLTGMWRTDSGM